MNLDELRSVQSKERQKDSLQDLRPSFYQEVGEYIVELKEERERAAEAASDPFSSPEVGRLTDEIETAKDVVEAIYERRMGKLVKQASLAAAGMPADDDGLTEEEQELFADLVARIRTNKGRVLDVLEWSEEATEEDVEPDSAPEGTAAPDTGEPAVGAGGTDPAGTPEPGDTPDPEGVSVADVMGGELPEESDPTATDAGPEEDDPVPEREAGADSGVGAGIDPDELIDGSGAEPGSSDSEPAGSDSSAVETDTDPGAGAGDRDRSADGGTASEPVAGGEEVDRVTVRITRDVGSILGVDDREYTLADDDVVTLPERNATPLVERDAAEPIE